MSYWPLEASKNSVVFVSQAWWFDHIRGLTTATDALPLHDEPAFLSAQVTARLEPIEKEVRRLIKKPKPKPPKVKANATATDVPANASTDANASSADGADGAEPGGGEPEPTIDAETAKAEPADTEDPPKEEL